MAITPDYINSETPFQPVAEVWRGGILESIHHGAAVAADQTGAILDRIGPHDLVTSLRSSAKPLQAIPMLTLPGSDGLDLSDEELAVCCASHPGEPRHAALAASVLALSGFLPDHLVCGSEGSPPSPLKHGCSGNHAAILLTAKLLDAPLETYHLPENPAQRKIARVVKELAGCSDLPTGIDGCGIPTFGLTLDQMARAYARLVDPSSPWLRIPRSMAAHPELVGHCDWIDVRLMKATDGRLIAKTGAEGLLCIADRSTSLGAAIKIADGSTRALGPFALRCLHRWGWISDAEIASPPLVDLIEPTTSVPDGRPASEIRVVLP